MSRNDLTQRTLNGSPLLVTVNHGATAGTARPAGASVVHWVGSVTPTNAIDGDMWTDTSATADALSLISSTTLGVAAASVTFSSIPATYSHLLVQMIARGDRAASNEDNVLVRFNGDSGANYDREFANFTNASAASGSVGQTSILIGNVPAAVSTANDPAVHQFLVAGYTSAFNKVLMSNGFESFDETNATSQIRWASGGKWRSTAAITSLTILAATANFVAGSIFSLYGMA